MEIINLRKVGQFFIRLSKGEEQVPPVADRKSVLKDNGLNVDEYDNVKFCVDTDTTVHFIVRSKKEIEKGEERVNDPNKHYAIIAHADEVYRRFYEEVPEPDDIPRKQELFEIRVGDYSVMQCK